MVQHKFFIKEFLLGKNVFHGGIGCKDAELILLKNGYKPIQLPYHDNFSIKAKYYRLIYVLKVFFTLPRNSSVVFLFDTYVFLHKILVILLTYRRSITLTCLIIDIDGIKDGNDKLLKQEIAFLKRIDSFIVHTNVIKRWIKERIPKAKIKSICFNDFLANPVNKHRVKSSNIIFAGNLAKSSFIKDLYKICENFPSLYFSLYGECGIEVLNNHPNIIYYGVYKPYYLPKKLIGSFGLVWDGNSIDGSCGTLGEYIKYISPHKLSLYIVAGVPVIAHEQAACAGLIRKYNVGFTVNSLYQICDKIKCLSNEEYLSMQKNCIPLAQRISKGLCLGDALNELENERINLSF